MKDVVFLVHRIRGGKPIEVNAEVYNAQPLTFSKDGWRKATLEEIKKAGHELEEIKTPPKKTRKKKTSPKED